MNTLKITLRDGYCPVEFSLFQPHPHVLRSEGGWAGSSARNEIRLPDMDQIVCLTVDDSLTSKEVDGLARTFTRRKPSAIRLGKPIMAIQVVEAGRGWPDDLQHGPTSMFGCLPAQDWTATASQPPVEAEHFLLNQPAGTVWIMGRLADGPPLSLRPDSIVKVEQRCCELLITTNPQSGTELLGHAVIRLKDDEATAGMAADLLAGRVKRIRINETVREVVLFPHPAWCRGTEPARPDYLDQTVALSCSNSSPKEDLICSACNSRAQDVACALNQEWKL